MTPEDHIFEQIEDYLGGHLSASQKEAFEKAIQEQPELSSKVKVHELAHDLVIENRLLHANDILIKHHQSQGGLSRGTKWGIASIIAAAGIGGALLYLNTTPPAPSKPMVASTISEKQVQTITDPVKTDVKEAPQINTIPGQRQPSAVKEEATATTATNHSASTQTGTPQETVVATKENKPIETIIAHTNAESPTAKPAPVDKCAGIQLHASLGQAAPCYGEQNGRLWLAEGKGGTAPYAIQVLDEHNHNAAAQLLGVGKYEVILTDAHGCISKQIVLLQAKICDKDYIFNPSAGESLQVAAYHANGLMKIFDKQGTLHATIPVSMDHEPSWNGQSKNGDINEGFYNFVIEYSDNMVAKGTITIVR